MRFGLLAGILVASIAYADPTMKVITDKGDHFVRINSKAPPTIGTEYTMTTDAAGTQVAGSAVVMEIRGALARITLDEAATKAKARFAKAPESTRSAMAPAKPSARPSAPRAAPPGPALKGKLEDGLRVVINNYEDRRWTDCVLRYDDGRYYKLGILGAHSEDTVLNFKFSSPPKPPPPPFDHVLVVCDEGKTKFFFNNPRSPGSLRGYAKPDGDRVTVYNSDDKDWHRCDVKKPDQTHYVIDRLEANDSNSIRGGAFEKVPEQEIRATQLSLTCAEGSLMVKL